MMYIPLYYYISNNFGDSMSAYIAAKISGKIPVLLDRDDTDVKYMITGSILNNDIENAISWGCGVAWSTDTIPAKTKICAVRGRLTGELCDMQGIAYDKVYGDPALLVPRLYQPKASEVKFKLGIIPHYVDTKKVLDGLYVANSNLKDYGVKIIDVLNSVEDVVDQIASCEKVVSSSLHGIITANAYGIPARWAKFTDLIGGDDFKFKDYFTTVAIGDESFLDYRESFGFFDILRLIDMEMPLPEILVDLDELFNSCPFLNLKL
jgi:pyruvyltransferase